MRPGIALVLLSSVASADAPPGRYVLDAYAVSSAMINGTTPPNCRRARQRFGHVALRFHPNQTASPPSWRFYQLQNGEASFELHPAPGAMVTLLVARDHDRAWELIWIEWGSNNTATCMDVVRFAGKYAP